MADEITISGSINIANSPLDYNSSPISFSADMTGRKGPTPGAVTVTTSGTVISLAQLTTPGICFIQNLDETNYVQYGIYDTTSSTFFPLGELLAGEFTILRLARDIGAEWLGTGTNVGNSLYFKANTASVVVRVDCFEN